MCCSVAGLTTAAAVVKQEMPELQPLKYGAAQRVLSCFPSV
jgi:hypothetical protein